MKLIYFEIYLFNILFILSYDRLLKVYFLQLLKMTKNQTNFSGIVDKHYNI